MKKLTLKLSVLLGVIAIACRFALPMLHAQNDPAKKEKAAEKKKQHDAEVLKKYDKNANGKLDPAEEAAMKADLEKARAEKKEKKDEKTAKKS